jgi:hypothetical protein
MWGKPASGVEALAAGNIGFDADKLRTFACPTDAVSEMTPSGGSDVPSARKQPFVTLPNADAREFAPCPVWPRGGVTCCPRRFNTKEQIENIYSRFKTGPGIS